MLTTSRNKYYARSIFQHVPRAWLSSRREAFEIVSRKSRSAGLQRYSLLKLSSAIPEVLAAWLRREIADLRAPRRSGNTIARWALCKYTISSRYRATGRSARMRTTATRRPTDKSTGGWLININISFPRYLAAHGLIHSILILFLIPFFSIWRSLIAVPRLVFSQLQIHDFCFFLFFFFLLCYGTFEQAPRSSDRARRELSEMGGRRAIKARRC